MIRAADHLAASLEDDPLLDPKAWRMNVAPEDGRPLDLNPILGADLSRNFATDDDGSRLNRCLDSGSLANDQGVWCENLAPEGAANSDGPQETEFPFKLATGLNDPRYGRRLDSYWECVVAGHV